MLKYVHSRRVARVLLFNSTGDRKPQQLMSYLLVLNFIAAIFVEFIGWTQPRHRVCKPAYLVPVPSQDKVEGLQQEGHPV